MKNITRKIFNKYTISMAGVAGSVLAAHVALLQFPDLVSDPLEKYMEENNIPLALVKDIDTSNIRVYDNDNILAPVHGAAFLAWRKMKLFINPQLINPHKAYEEYYSGFTKVSNVGYDTGSAYMFSDGADTMITMYDEIPFEYISLVTGIPVEDIEIDEKYTDLIFFRALAHEISHIGYHKYNSSCSNNNKTPIDYNTNESKRSIEIMADLGAIDLMKNIDIDMSEYTISMRSFAPFRNISSSHSTAVYLDALLEGKECGDLPDPIGHDEDRKKLINIIINYSINAGYDFPIYNSGSYVIYHLLLDFLENINTHDDITSRMKRTAELYVEGFEFFAPTRAAEIRRQRDLVNQNTNEAVPSV